MADIPEVFNQPGAAFVLLPAGIKFPPIEKEWQKKGHSFREVTAHKGNIGIMAGNAFIGVDEDDPSAFQGLELPISTTWQTRPGRLGMWFKCSDVAEALQAIGKKPGQAQLKLFKDGKPCGEVKLERTYQVIPPSWKALEDGQRADYKLLREIPPAEISLVKLLSDLQSIGVTFSSKLEQNAVRLESMGGEARKRRAESDESRTRRYAEAALQSESLAVAGSPTGSRNEALNTAAFSLGQFVSAGALSEAEVRQELSRAAMSAGLELEEIRATIMSGLEAGAKHPREVPASEKKTPARKETGISTEASDAIRAKAREILLHGDPVSFVMAIFNRLHVGDTQLGKILLCSVASQSVLNGEGLQPKLSGDSGKGKTHACKAMAHLIPRDWVLECSLSSKALFYYPDMRSGMIVFSDDLQLSEDLEGTLKRSMTNFQQRTKHLTLDSKRNVLALELPERLCWWLTSVNDEGDLQLLNRFMGVGIDDTPTQDTAVTDWQLLQAEKGELAFPEDDEILVCREIFRSFKEKAFKVSIPFARRINWLDSGDRRNLPRFLDLIRAFAVLRFMQRERNNNTLLADLQDFKDAADLYQTRAENQISKLTDAELSLARWMVGKGELTLSDILGRHTKPSGKPYTRQGLMNLLHGRKGREGLLSKVPGLDYFQETTKDADTGRSIKKNVYVLPVFDTLSSFGLSVSLKPDNIDGATSCNHGATHVQQDKVTHTNNNSNNNSVVDATELRKTKDSVEENDPKLACVDSSSCSAEKVAPTPHTESLAIEKPAFENQLHRGCSEVAPVLHRSCTCAACGLDLTDKGRIEKNGKFYCARPGCGYPPRVKVEGRQ